MDGSDLERYFKVPLLPLIGATSVEPFFVQLIKRMGGELNWRGISMGVGRHPFTWRGAVVIAQGLKASYSLLF
jgi:hypothetical protein